MGVYTDYVQGPGSGTAAVANRVLVGSLTLPAGNHIIRRIWAHAAQVGTFAASKPLLGYIEVESKDCPIEPFDFPLEAQGGYLTLGGAVSKQPATKWIVNCPSPGGTVLKFYHVPDVAGNAAPEVIVTVEFSDGEPFGDGQQLHMEMAEPAVSASTSDNGETSNTDIEVKATHLHMIVAYIAFTTSVADSSAHACAEVSSSDLLEPGPLNFGLEPDVGGDANMVTTSPMLTKLPTVRSFKSPGQKQTLSCKIIMRDAVSTAPLSNWGVVYS